jgi:hypothetical protein
MVQSRPQNSSTDARAQPFRVFCLEPVQPSSKKKKKLKKKLQLPPIKAKLQWKKMKTTQLEKDKDAMALLDFFRGTPLWRYYCEDRTHAGKKIKDQWRMEKDLPKDLQRIANKERRSGQTPATLTSDQIRVLTRFAPTIRSWFPHAFRSEGQLKTQFAYLLEEVNPNMHKFVLPPRVIHLNYPCLIGDHLVRVIEGSDPGQQAQQEPPTTSDSVNPDTYPG